MKDTNNKQLSASTLLIGLAIGGVLGVLFAPCSGKKTRRNFVNRKDDILELMKVRLHAILEDMKDKLEHTSVKAAKFLEIEKALNSKIMKITNKILNECPELIKYLEEMPVKSFSSNDPEITLRNLQTYANSLENMHKKYITENHIQSK